MLIDGRKFSLSIGIAIPQIEEGLYFIPIPPYIFIEVAPQLEKVPLDKFELFAVAKERVGLGQHSGKEGS